MVLEVGLVEHRELGVCCTGFDFLFFLSYLLGHFFIPAPSFTAIRTNPQCIIRWEHAPDFSLYFIFGYKCRKAPSPKNRGSFRSLIGQSHKQRCGGVQNSPIECKRDASQCRLVASPQSSIPACTTRPAEQQQQLPFGVNWKGLYAATVTIL